MSEPDARLQIRQVTCAAAAGLLLGVGLSWKLWISSRLFPLCPVGDFLPALPSPFDCIPAAVWLALLAGIIISARRARWLFIAFFALAALLLAQDQMRWQPWVYQYLFLLLACAFASRRERDPTAGALALDSCRWILVASYFWSGLDKLNVTFLRQTWPEMAAGLVRWLPPLAKLPPALALLIPVIEIAIAIGLVLPRARKIAATLAFATHAIILTSLVASGENTVVWPWNLAMSSLVWILFWREREARLVKRYPLLSLPSATLVLFGLLPALSLCDAWDSYLSGSLYSGNIRQAVIYLSQSQISRLPAEMQPHVWQENPPYFLDINRWAFGELNVPVYPEPRIFKRVTAQVCARVPPDESGPRLRILGKPNPFRGTRESEFYDCEHLRDY